MNMITIKVPEKAAEGLKAAFEHNKKKIRPEVLKRLKWDDFDVFKGDLLRYGIIKVQEEEGIELIEMIRNERDPIFKDEEEYSSEDIFGEGIMMFR